MPYLVEAWLDNGTPRVRLRDPASGSVSLDWTYKRLEETPNPSGYQTGAALHALLRDLFRLACAERLNVKHMRELNECEHMPCPSRAGDGRTPGAKS